MDAVLISAAVLILNILVTSGGLVWAVANIKADLKQNIADAREDTAAEIAKLRAEFLADQKSQDHRFGEVGAAMRQYIANVEKEMHAIETWGRDHFVRKEDFLKATDKISDDIRSMAADIKSDFRDLNAKIDKAT